jgi:hypothetical protein
MVSGSCFTKRLYDRSAKPGLLKLCPLIIGSLYLISCSQENQKIPLKHSGDATASDKNNQIANCPSPSSQTTNNSPTLSAGIKLELVEVNPTYQGTVKGIIDQKCV